MHFSTRFLTASAIIAAPFVAAQTYTSCNPLNETCPPDTALGTTYFQNFTTSAADSKIWNQTYGTINFGQDGAEFTIAQKGDSPTLQSQFYIFGGRVSTVMKAAGGMGIVSSVVLLSDDLDEIDWEILGETDNQVSTNFYGKGNASITATGKWFPCENNQDYHNYTTVWTKESIEWILDGTVIRTQYPNDSLTNFGKDFPQSPMYVKINPWAGGDATENRNGTVQWATNYTGQTTDYSKGPFTMVIQSIEVEDFSSGSLYTYGDYTGSWDSIKITPGNSTIADRLNSVHGVTAKYNALSKTAKIAIAAAALSVAAIAIASLAFCCVKYRRAGRRERAIADAEYERQVNELQSYKRMMVAEEEIHPRAGYI